MTAQPDEAVASHKLNNIRQWLRLVEAEVRHDARQLARRLSHGRNHAFEAEAAGVEASLAAICTEAVGLAAHFPGLLRVSARAELLQQLRELLGPDTREGAAI